ncbi:glycosyltransferase family 2 protein [Virgibacillus sp. W0181]|uniref:glycosyltransferase family 2 protein n=1 Tax=Virgibacillus sp. W0181 TaxID=3391581 RepID=UPI003F46B40F
MNSPSISISITVYNLEKYVEKCIESILNQEFTDFELIIIDDGSTDQSSEICKYYEQEDKRITYIYQPNQGVSAARNRAIEASTGKYILMADGDDQLESTMLAKLFDLCESNSADISTCMNYLVDENSQILGTPTISTKVHLMSNEEALFKMYRGKLTGYGLCNKLYRRELFKNVSFPVDRNFEDAAVQYRLILQANKVIFTEERLYFYVIHSESMTRKKLAKYSNKRLDIIQNFRESMDYLKQNNTSKCVLDIMAADYYKSLRGLVIDIMKENKDVRRNALKIVTHQLILWKPLFVDNQYVSKKETYLIQCWSRLPKLTLVIYYIRNRFVLNS